TRAIMIMWTTTPLRVATLATAPIVTRGNPVSRSNTSAGGASDAPSSTGGTATTAIQTTTKYSTAVIPRVRNSARGKVRVGSFNSSEMLTKCSKPRNANTATRLDPSTETQAAASPGPGTSSGSRSR